MTDGTEYPSIQLMQCLFRYRRKRIAVPFVAFFADREFVPLDVKGADTSSGFHHLDGLRHYFLADIVSE